MVPISRGGGMSRVAEGSGASLFDVMHGTGVSRAVMNKKGN